MNGLYVSGRQRTILNLLLQAQGAVTVKEIAAELGVSVRTIHRDIKDLAKIASDFRLNLFKQAGIGISIQGEEQDKQKLQSAITTITTADLTPEERKAILISTLLEMNEPVKMFTLANELNVTIAAISHDLDQLEEELTAFDLKLIRKKGYGVEIEGDEAHKRAALSNLITRNIDPFEFVARLKESIQHKSDRQADTISTRLLGLVNPEKLSIIEQRVEDARDKLPYELADSGYIGLVVHLALAIERLQKGDTIQFDQAYLRQIEGTREYEIAKTIIRELEASFAMEIPDDEIGYITMHLMGAKLRTNQDYLIEDSSIDIAFKAKKLIRYVSDEMNTNLTQNNKLLNDLTAHLKPAVYRLKQRMNISNPMIKEIKRDYHEFFQILERGAIDIFPDIRFPDDEIGYLVLHFAATMLQSEKSSDINVLVICSSGIGTSKILATKLMQKFPEIKQVENKSFFDLKDSALDRYELIVSTIPLEGLDREYILTSPMLTETEIKRIQKEIRKKRLTSAPKASVAHTEVSEDKDFLIQLESMQNYSKAVLDLLKVFQVNQMEESNQRSIQTLLESICMELEQRKIITNSENVLNKLLSRETTGGLGIPNTNLALYHTRSAGIQSPSFTIYSLKQPVVVKGMDGEDMSIRRILLMLAPEVALPEVLDVLSYLSGVIIQGQESIDLFESGSETDIKKFLSKQFHQFLKEKNLV
ncbi:BglG family transcription antiterminator [Oceanobacillus massiliensis]|uniref:BglG family transcription antiterminator n=1 Tax=Oceanobacillus massiliensis TaxID=1465765 RepID=UPI001F3787D6|nr:BglG family transcription antiterminator [Oceanobacillus massiliensis]